MSKRNKITIGIYSDIYCEVPDEISDYKWSQLKQRFLTFNEMPTKMKGTAWSPAILGPGSVRCGKNVKAWSVLTLDFANKRYKRVRAALKDIGWAAVAHSTFSNTKDANHFRVIMRLNRPLRRWEAPLIQQFVNSQLGGGADPVRTLAPVYLFPSHPVGMRHEAFCEEFFGPKLEVEHVWDWLECREEGSKLDDTVPMDDDRS